MLFLQDTRAYTIEWWRQRTSPVAPLTRGKVLMKPLDRATLMRHAKAGDASAQKYFDLLTVCEHVLAQSNGKGLAYDMIRPREDVYGVAIDEALSSLMPVVLTVVGGTFEELKWSVPTVVAADPPEVPRIRRDEDDRDDDDESSTSVSIRRSDQQPNE